MTRARDRSVKLVVRPAHRRTLRLGELEVAAIPGEIYPELVLGKVVDPAEKGADFPDAPAYRQELARTLTNYGALLQTRGRRGEAEKLYARAVAEQGNA